MFIRVMLIQFAYLHLRRGVMRIENIVNIRFDFIESMFLDSIETYRFNRF